MSDDNSNCHHDWMGELTGKGVDQMISTGLLRVWCMKCHERRVLQVDWHNKESQWRDASEYNA
jgi:hypothetical protein